MAGITKWNGAGFDSLQWTHRSALGYLTGAANLTVANVGLSSSMARYRGANTSDFTLPAKTIVNIPGDDGTRATFQFDGDGLPTFNLDMSDFDAVFYAAATGQTVVTDGDTQAVPMPFVGGTSNVLGLMFTNRLKSQTAGQVGAAGYEHLELFNCECSYLGHAWNTKGAIVYRWQVVANNVDVLWDGRSVDAVYTTAPAGELGAVIRTSDNRFSYSVLVGDAAETDITTAYKPISIAKSKATLETTGFAADTVTAIDIVTPYGITPTGVPGSGKISVARYEFLNYE